MASSGNSCGITDLDLALLTASEGKRSDITEENVLVPTNVVGIVDCASILPPKARIPLPSKPFKHSFYTVENDIIVNYDFTLLKTEITPASDLFRVS